MGDFFPFYMVETTPLNQFHIVYLVESEDKCTFIQAYHTLEDAQALKEELSLAHHTNTNSEEN